MIINVQEQEALLQPKYYDEQKKRKKAGHPKGSCYNKEHFYSKMYPSPWKLVFLFLRSHQREEVLTCVDAGVPVAQVNQSQKQSPSCTAVHAMAGQRSRAVLLVLWHFAAIFLQCLVILIRQCPYGGWN